MSKSTGKRRYQVDLVKQQTLCQANYARLLQLLPMLADQDQCQLAIHHQYHCGEVTLAILERSRYTTLLQLEYGSQWPDQVAAPELKVRVYHDAQMAEVVGAEHQQRLAPRYNYPNEQMFQPDEKLQLNQFLADWISHCLDGAYHPDEVCINRYR